MHSTSIKQADPSSPLKPLLANKKKVSSMPFSPRGGTWTVYAGIALGFVAMLGYTGNLNRHFFRNVMDKWTRGQSHISMEGSKKSLD